MNVASLFAAPLDALGGYVLPFLLVLTVVVFVHEFGHFLVARWCEVDVEVFSIGFGREIFGWHDRHGTRWKVCGFRSAAMSNSSATRTSLASRSRHRWQRLPQRGERRPPFSARGSRRGRRSWPPARSPTSSWRLSSYRDLKLYGRQTVTPRVDIVLPSSAAAAAGFARRRGRDRRQADRDLLATRSALLLDQRPTASILIWAAAARLSVISATPEQLRPTGSGRSTGWGHWHRGPKLPARVRRRTRQPRIVTGYSVRRVITAIDGQRIDGFEELQKLVRVAAKRLRFETSADRAMPSLSMRSRPLPMIWRRAKKRSAKLGVPAPTTTLPISAVSPIGRWGVGKRPRDLVLSTARRFPTRPWSLAANRPTSSAVRCGLRRFPGRWPRWVSTHQPVSSPFSISIGLSKLFPIPMLDGGHLLFFAVEAIRGPLSERSRRSVSGSGWWRSCC